MDAPSQRQLQVLGLYADGLTRQQIADELIIALDTVRAHLRDVRSILGATNSTHAVTICIARGLLCVDHRKERVYIPAPLVVPDLD